MQSISRIIFIALAATLLSFFIPISSLAQNAANGQSFSPTSPAAPINATTRSTTHQSTDTETNARISALEETLKEQRAQLEEMQKLLSNQQRVIKTLAEKLDATASPKTANGSPSLNNDLAASANNSSSDATATQSEQASALDARLKKVEDQVLKIGPLRFSGDFRLRADGILRPASKAPDPPLAHVQNVRARYRLRLNFDTDLYPALSFHGQLATGPINNQLTMDQDFTSTTVRHPFFISEAWIDYHPRKSIQLQAGRVQEVFADNSRFLFDDDIRFNGFNEKYVVSPGKKPLDISSIEFRAGQYILTSPNVAVITAGSPLDHAGQVVGTIGRSANLFHQGLLFNQKFNDKWSDQFGGDVQLYRNPNEIALASTNEGLVLLIQPGLGLALSGPLPGTGTATTTAGGAIYSARNFQIARFTYRLNYAGFERAGHSFPIAFNLQLSRNLGTGLSERDALLASVQVGKITKRGDSSFLYVFAIKGANAMISQVTDDDLGTGTGVNIRTNHFRFDYGLAKKVTFQSLLFIQNELRNSGPNFFVPLGAFTPRQYRFQEQLVFSF